MDNQQYLCIWSSEDHQTSPFMPRRKSAFTNSTGGKGIEFEYQSSGMLGYSTFHDQTFEASGTNTAGRVVERFKGSEWTWRGGLPSLYAWDRRMIMAMTRGDLVWQRREEH